jgi:5'-nucleotidase|tara:strand:+ start:431 stop:1330 length:900 start_codon:yes stop_codon:yes gene_type:complete
LENLNLLTVAVSSSALFDLTESDSIYQNEGLEAYRRYQIQHEEQVLEPGEGFLLVKKLLSLNDQLGDSPVEVILLSRNSADTGLRVFNSIEAHKLNITRAAFCSGDSPYKYIRAFGSDLFLSTNAEDVRQALDQQVAAATLIGSTVAGNRRRFSNQLKIAFDGDSVLFSDEAERVFQESGLDAFSRSEASSAEEPLEGGPFKNFLFALHKLQQQFSNDDLPIRTALVTSRGAPAHERVIKTLRHWDIRLDESLFLGGRDKGEFLKSFEADIFFDDQAVHCENASSHVASGHVPSGVANE